MLWQACVFLMGLRASAAGAAAVAPEGGALACPSALNPPPSSWLALVTLKPCHAWHGWGQGGVKSGGSDPRIGISREA
jgi:hypothetical protein